MLRVILFLMALIFISLYAFKKGEKPERIVALTFISTLFADMALHVVFVNTYAAINISHLIVDSFMWIVFVGLALKANRLWTLVVAALQTVTVCSHAVRIFNIELNPHAYGIMQVAGFYPMLLILAVGTWRHQQRRMQMGSDPSWSM
jgi:hypothetical protein